MGNLESFSQSEHIIQSVNTARKRSCLPKDAVLSGYLPLQQLWCSSRSEQYFKVDIAGAEHFVLFMTFPILHCGAGGGVEIDSGPHSGHTCQRWPTSAQN
ncbi:hypothetical protein ACOMHN_045878 [Nucella lapillus]